MDRFFKIFEHLLVSAKSKSISFEYFGLFPISFSNSLATTVMVDKGVLERIKPIGEVRIDSSTMVASADSTETAERSGEEIYNGKCAGCHTSGIMGAPKYASLADWTSRIDLGLDKLTASAIAGKGGMPARGTCMDCSDNDIKVTVQYMLDSLE